MYPTVLGYPKLSHITLVIEAKPVYIWSLWNIVFFSLFCNVLHSVPFYRGIACIYQSGICGLFWNILCFLYVLYFLSCCTEFSISWRHNIYVYIWNLWNILECFNLFLKCLWVFFCHGCTEFSISWMHNLYIWNLRNIL